MNLISVIFLAVVATISSKDLSAYESMSQNSLDAVNKTCSLPRYHNKNSSEIPDYYQRSSEFGKLPDNGAAYCGPVSISNSFVHLARQGFDNIISVLCDSDKEQHELIKLLGSSRYINTGKEGSSPQAMCDGVSRFLQDRGYDSARLEYYGWRQVSSKFNTGISVPDLNIVKAAIVNGYPVWLNIGWYRYSKKGNKFRRCGGHWVTLTGYGFNKGKLSENTLIVNDPDSRYKGNEYIDLERIKSGVLTNNFSKSSVNASGFYRWKQGSGIYGIIDGFIILKIEKQPFLSFNLPSVSVW